MSIRDKGFGELFPILRRGGETRGEFMSLILCRQEPVKHPYYIDVLGIHIHSSQELCYIVYNHPVLVMDDFLDDLLIDFIRKDLDMDYLAGRMEKLVETGTQTRGGSGPFPVGMRLLQRQGNTEIQADHSSSPGPCIRPSMKSRGRITCLGSSSMARRRPGMVKFLNTPRDKVVEDLFLAKVYNNLGACYAMMFQFHKALGCYDKAYELGKDDALLKRIYFLTVFAPELDVKDKVPVRVHG